MSSIPNIISCRSWGYVDKKLLRESMERDNPCKSNLTEFLQKADKARKMSPGEEWQIGNLTKERERSEIKGGRIL